ALPARLRGGIAAAGARRRAAFAARRAPAWASAPQLPRAPKPQQPVPARPLARRAAAAPAARRRRTPRARRRGRMPRAASPRPRHPLPVAAPFVHSLVRAYAFPIEQPAPLLPPGLSLDTYGGHALAAVAIVQTRSLRPRGLPAALGLDFVLCGYRIFVRVEGR